MLHSPLRALPAHLVLTIVVIAAGLAGLVPTAGAATLVAPSPGERHSWYETAPWVAFDPAEGERPRWVLLSTDAGMRSTVRYCRAFVWHAARGGWHWGCNRWATGVDAAGNDRLRPLESGRTYFWQVVSRDADGDAMHSAVRSFRLDRRDTDPSVPSISNQVIGSSVGDGTLLNRGAAAWVNSRVRVDRIASVRRSTWRFQVGTTFTGGIDARRSYVRVQSAAGTRYLAVRLLRPGVVAADWVPSLAERRLTTRRYVYQTFLRSSRNGAMVRSQARVMLIR